MKQSDSRSGAHSQVTRAKADFAGRGETATLASVEAIPERIEESALESMYLVLVHNDDVTPYEYVVHILEHFFLLSDELAEHVAWTAHTEGSAVVIVRPRTEAIRLVILVNGRARLDGQPLTFSAEPER